MVEGGNENYYIYKVEGINLIIDLSLSGVRGMAQLDS